MKKIIQKIIQYITPNPYIEVEGIKFWSKRSYNQYLKNKPFIDAGKTHSIKRYISPGPYAYQAKFAYSEFLNFVNINKCPYRIIDRSFAPCNGRFEVEYVCDNIFKCNVNI